MHSPLRIALFACFAMVSASVHAQSPRAEREMQIHKVKELGLEIWTENQPPWDTQLLTSGAYPVFVAQSPPHYYPPTVMTYLALPTERIATAMLATTAVTAIRRAAANYGVPAAERILIQPQPARHGQLQGYEATFDGRANEEAVAVRLFVGQAAGKAPVALQAYTLPGKLSHLQEPIRRAWGKLGYLD